MDITSRSSENKYVIFKLGEEFYGIDIYNVKSIEKLISITRIPNSPEYIRGVINLRGEVVPVICLRKRFGLPYVPSDANSRIIILTINNIQIGLIVDSSSEVIQLYEEDIDAPPVITNELSDDFIMGLGKKDNKLIILLDLNKVIGANNIQDFTEV